MTRPRARLRDFPRARSGASAVEFAMVAAPFFFMMFAILELAMVFVIDSTLENATVEAGRLVRTGQAAQQKLTAAQFKDRMCARMSIFQSQCAGQTTVDVRVLPSFKNANPPDPMAGGKWSDSNMTYQPGAPGSLILVRTWYKQTLFTPFLQQGLSRLGDGKAVLTATTAFRNEPYPVDA